MLTCLTWRRRHRRRGLLLRHNHCATSDDNNSVAVRPIERSDSIGPLISRSERLHRPLRDRPRSWRLLLSMLRLLLVAAKAPEAKQAEQPLYTLTSGLNLMMDKRASEPVSE